KPVGASGAFTHFRDSGKLPTWSALGVIKAAAAVRVLPEMQPWVAARAEFLQVFFVAFRATNAAFGGVFPEWIVRSSVKIGKIVPRFSRTSPVGVSARRFHFRNVRRAAQRTGYSAFWGVSSEGIAGNAVKVGKQVSGNPAAYPKLRVLLST